MRKCPACKKTYDNTWKVCLNCRCALIEDEVGGGKYEDLHISRENKITREDIKDFAKAIQSFNQELRLIRVILCAELVFELKNTVDEEYIGFLAAQIVNFLTGEAINDCYQKADDSMKLKIDKIRDRILPCAHDKMKKDYKARELIVYTLRMSEVFDFAIKKEAHLDSEQHKSRLDILSTYGAEFPIEANPELYEQIVTNYYKERYKFVENNKRRI